MRAYLMAATAGLALLAAGCNREPSASEANATNAIEINVAAESVIAVPLGNADFANAIAGGGKFEIDSAALAATKATSNDLKALAAMISSDHKTAGEQLKAAASASSPSFTPLASLNAKQKADINALNGASGSEFDRLYIAQQVAAHQETIGILKSYATGGASPQLKNFASQVLPVVQGHLDKLTALPK